MTVDVAYAGVQGWQLNELHRRDVLDGSQIQFVELWNLEGGCLFPSTNLRLYDTDGVLLQIAALVTSTRCFGANSHLLLTSDAGSEFFETPKDLQLSLELPDAGQLCISSSGTKYDCVRWGDISMPLVDLFGSLDVSSLDPLMNNSSFARTQTSHIIADDWELRAPTPRSPNDGSSWFPPDAGMVPDASQPLDSGVVADAPVLGDAAYDPDASIRPEPRYLDLDAGGGGCACRAGQGKSGWLFAVLCLLLLRRRRV